MCDRYQPDTSSIQVYNIFQFCIFQCIFNILPRLRCNSTNFRFLFRVLLNSGNWRRDTTLRVECLYNNTGCCRKVQLDSEARVGPVSRYQSNLLGNYTATDLHNGRYLYTRDIGNEHIGFIERQTLIIKQLIFINIYIYIYIYHCL